MIPADLPLWLCGNCNGYTLIADGLRDDNKEILCPRCKSWQPCHAVTYEQAQLMKATPLQGEP